MLNLFALMKKPKTLDIDEIAQLLKTNPEAIKAFESQYQALPEDTSNFFKVSKGTMNQMINEKMAIESGVAPEQAIEIQDQQHSRELMDRIVNELLAQTKLFIFDGNLATAKKFPALPEGKAMVSKEEIMSLPMELRPEFSGNLMMRDIEEEAYISILDFYVKAQNERDPKKKKHFYNMFRSGLDILDLDPITYRIIDQNRNSIGHWLPALVDACRGTDFFKIPATTIAQVPLPILQQTRREYAEHNRVSFDILDQWAMKAFSLDPQKTYFVKTGTYSSKFDFRNTKVTGEKEVRELGEYLLFIHFQALQMAAFTVQPHPIYGVSTTTEWAVREYIEDKDNCPCIYHGMPLHTEYRVFIDADTNQVIGIVPYWDPETMEKRFRSGAMEQDPDHMHDYVIYKAHEETLMNRYNQNKDLVVQKVTEFLPDLKLHGQWSLDIMQNGKDFWLIDMGVAENSAFYDRVPKELRNPTPENWIPQLEE